MSTDSSVVKPYLLTIRILPQKEGINVPRLIRKISEILVDYPRATRTVHKFKVIGEAQLFVIIEASNSIGLERILEKLWEAGPVDIQCQPLVPYEKFARSLAVAEDLCQETNCVLNKDGIYLLDVNIEYQGKTLTDLLAIWKKEAETVLGLRCKGLSKLHLYKTVAQRQVFVILNADDPAVVDQLTFQLPIFQENGENIQVRSKEFQLLDDYVARISDEKL